MDLPWSGAGPSDLSWPRLASLSVLLIIYRTKGAKTDPAGCCLGPRFHLEHLTRGGYGEGFHTNWAAYALEPIQ